MACRFPTIQGGEKTKTQPHLGAEGCKRRDLPCCSWPGELSTPRRWSKWLHSTVGRNKAGFATIPPPLRPCWGQEPVVSARPPVPAKQHEVNALRAADGSGHTFPISANGSHVATSLCNGLKNVSPQCLGGKCTFVRSREVPLGYRSSWSHSRCLTEKRNHPGSGMASF